MKTPLVEIDGDEMTRVLWALVKEKTDPALRRLKTEYYDLGLMNRDATDDAVTAESARAILRLGVGVKCATITSNAARKVEYDLKALHPSPNATIRAILDGTVFRMPIVLSNVKATVSPGPNPSSSAAILRGRLQNAVRRFRPGMVELVFPGQTARRNASGGGHAGAGIVQGMHTSTPHESFARASSSSPSSED
jgi:isocitrate dehydrogenase